MKDRFARAVHARRVTARSHVDTTRLVRPSDFESTIVQSIAGAMLVDALRGCLPIYVDWHAERLAFSHWRSTMPPTAVPFLYQHQRGDADTLIDVPFERLDDLGCAEGMRPTFVFSIGRCGSTLLSKLLLAAGEQSLSEPDVLTHVAQFDDEDLKLRAAGGESLIGVPAASRTVTLSWQSDRPSPEIVVRSASRRSFAGVPGFGHSCGGM